MDELFKGLDTPINLMASDTKRDKVVGQDELGRTIYENVDGGRYVVDAVQAPVSIPETAKQLYDNAPPMEEWSLPSAGQVVNAAKDVISSGAQEVWDLVSAPTNPDATLGDVVGIVSSMGSPAAVKALEGVAVQGVDIYDPTTLRMFFGPNSPKANLSELDRAKQMADSGRDPKDIWMTTGWWESPNGWRFEVSDKDLQIHPIINQAVFSEPADVGRPLKTNFEQAVQHDEFFDALPTVPSLASPSYGGDNLRLANSSKQRGSYNTISGDIFAAAPDREELKSVLLHEMQHMEQGAGDSPSTGANPDRFYRDIDQTLTQLPREALEYLVNRREIDLLINQLDVQRQAIKKNVPKGWEATGFDFLDNLDLDQLDYSITELKRQRNQNKTDFSQLYGENFKKSLDDLYTLTGGFTNLLRDTQGDGLKRPLPHDERGQKIAELAFDLYQRNAGEAEARLTAKRKDYSGAERALKFPGDDFDIDPESIIDEYLVRKVLNNVSAEWDNVQNSKPRFAEGGVVENSRVDPVSGNPVPPGATPKEVRDDVDIKASEGEYIIPANVVRYLGLDKIEKMVSQAKEKLAEMESNGRMGGQKGGEDDLPFGPEELMTTDGAPAQEKPKMAEGGLVSPQPFTTNQWNQEIDPVTGKPRWAMFFGDTPTATPAPAPTPTTGAATTPVSAQGTAWVSDTDRDRAELRQPLTGIAGSVDNWTPKDFVNYNRQKTDPAAKAIQGGIMTMLPMGGALVAARHKYLNREVPQALERMLSTGKDLQGNPLSERDMASLRGVQQNMPRSSGKDDKERRGLAGLFDNIGNKLENFGNKLSGKSNSSKSIGSKSSGPSSGLKKGSVSSGGSSGSISLSGNKSSGSSSSGFISRPSSSSNTSKTNSTPPSKSSSSSSSSSSKSTSSTSKKK